MNNVFTLAKKRYNFIFYLPLVPEFLQGFKFNSGYNEQPLRLLADEFGLNGFGWMVRVSFIVSQISRENVYLRIALS